MLFFTQAIKRAVQIAPGGVSTVYGNRRQTWTTTLDRVRRMAAALRKAGISNGERVAILALNSDRYLELIYAVAWAGGVFVPMNTRWSVPELAYGLSDCQAAVLCVDDEFVETAGALERQVAINTVIFIGEQAIPEGMADYERMIAESDACEDAERSGEQLAGIFYTGGTTGHPKGVMLSNANIIFASLNWLGCLYVVKSTVYMHVAGFFHLGGASPAFATTLAGGTNVVLPKFAPVPAMQAIEENKVNYVLLIPVMVNALLSDPALSHHDLSSVEMCHYGGSPMPEAVLRKIMTLLPTWKFHQGYGLTETSAIFTTLDWSQHAVEGPLMEKLTSAGQVCPGWELKITDAHSHALPRGKVGEIVVRGAGTMLGYWGKPDATAAVIRNGWMHTGDGGYMDDDGFVFIVDRVKDMIISGGENIYSVEVENALYKHPAVRECAVIGIPDDTWGEKVHAIVVTHEGVTVSDKEIVDHCRTLIAGYKVPRSIELTTTPLPVSPTGKITKNVLREKFWVGKTRNVN